MRTLSLLSLLVLPAPAAAGRRSGALSIVPTVPSVAEVVAQEGFVPTPSQSETYRPGVVLVPDAQGGHDEVHPDCIGVAPSSKIMSQSSIATSLSLGVSARLSAVRGQIAGGIEKRLSFVDPEQRTIPLSMLNPSPDCAAGLQTAARFTDLSQAILVYDVLVAQIQNTVCIRADANGSVMMLGEAEAAAYSECVQESDAQVPLGFKFVPLSQVFDSGLGHSAPSVPGQPAAATASVHFGRASNLHIDAQLKAQACERIATERGKAARTARLDVAEMEATSQATAAWLAIAGDLERCMGLAMDQRGRCVAAAQQWLAQAQAMTVSIPAGVEPIETECGLMQPAFAAASRVVPAVEVAAGRAMLMRLAGSADRIPDDQWVQFPGGILDEIRWETGSVEPPERYDPVSGAVFRVGQPQRQLYGSSGRTQVVSSFELMKTEVTVEQYRQCVIEGGCTTPDAFIPTARHGQHCNWGQTGREDHPINCVDWSQAQAFAEWAGGRLPTESEWEYAARSGGKPWAFPWGDEPAATCSRAVMSGDAGMGCGSSSTLPVCSKTEGNSTQGVCDLVGNVWEWFQDRYRESLWAAPSDSREQEDGAQSIVIRGGSWFDTATLLDTSSRKRADPDTRFALVGFRLAR